MGGLEVNSARIIYNNLTKHQTSILPYGAFLTRIYKKFQVDLSSETNVVGAFELFYHIVLFRMKFLSFQPPPPSSTKENPSSHVPFTSIHHTPPPTELHTTQGPQFSTQQFSDAYYITFTAEVLSIKDQQASILESQATLLQNQSLLMKHFESMSNRMDHMYENQ